MNDKKLTLKQNKFVAEYVNTGNATQSAIKAGYSENSAYSIGNENLNKPEIQKAIQKLMQEHGLSDELIVKKLSEGLEAVKLINDVKLPDYSIRHKYLDTLLKIKGLYALSGDGVNINNGLTFEDVIFILRNNRNKVEQ